MSYALLVSLVLAVLPVLAPVVTQVVKKGAEKLGTKVPSVMKPVVNVAIGGLLAAAGDVVTPVVGVLTAMAAGKVYEVNKAEKAKK